MRPPGSQVKKVAQGKKWSPMANVTEISRNITAEKWLLVLIMCIGDLDTRSLVREKERNKWEIGAYNILLKSFAMKGRQK